MPKTELTDAEVVELLARFLGFRSQEGEYGEHLLINSIGIELPEDWNPLDDLNAIHELEERLTEWQRKYYEFYLERNIPIKGGLAGRAWAFRHADARTCAYAMAEVVKGEKDA